MGRQMDWVPWNFGVSQTPLSLTTGFVAQFPLLAPGQLDTAQVSGVIEDQQRYFVHRIVGQYQMIGVEGLADATITISPGFLEVQGTDQVTTLWGTTTYGGTVAGAEWTAQLSNNEFWYFRHTKQFDTYGFSPIEHPWWSTVDIKPKRVMSKAQAPTLVFSCERGSFQFFFQLRALITRI